MPEQETGFEINGQFYKWKVSDHAKDLMLIDRFTQMPAHLFFEMIEEGLDRGRGPMLLAMMATSMRDKHKDWSVERISNVVLNVSMSEVTFFGEDEDEEEGASVPPEVPGEAPAEPAPAEESGSSSSETSNTSADTQ